MIKRYRGSVMTIFIIFLVMVSHVNVVRTSAFPWNVMGRRNFTISYPQHFQDAQVNIHQPTNQQVLHRLDHNRNDEKSSMPIFGHPSFGIPDKIMEDIIDISEQYKNRERTSQSVVNQHTELQNRKMASPGNIIHHSTDNTEYRSEENMMTVISRNVSQKLSEHGSKVEIRNPEQRLKMDISKPVSMTMTNNRTHNNDNNNNRINIGVKSRAYERSVRKGHVFSNSFEDKSLENEKNRIIFPDELESVKQKLIHRLIRPKCESDTGICEDISYYPNEIIKNELKAKPNLKILETNDTIEPDIDVRFGDMDDSLCVSTEDIVRPKAAATKDNKWMYIVNNDQFVQAIRVEICRDKDLPCTLINGFAEGYETTCKQKYIYRQLVALDINGKMKSESFRIPASCCCHVRFIGDMWLRMGGGTRNNAQTPVNTKNGTS